MWRAEILLLVGGSAEGRFDRLPAVAAELVGLNVDVIVATEERCLLRLPRM